MKSLYIFKNLSQRQLMKYLHQNCSMYSVVIKVFITLRFRLINKILLNELITKWLLLKRSHSHVSWFIKTKSDLQTQRNFRTEYGRDPPSRLSIRAWYKKFMETMTVFDKERSGRPEHLRKTWIV